jgi:nucleotide-binding universal stress UspA family protein
MKKIEKILAPTDFSELSASGVQYALELARSWSSTITLLNVADAAELANYQAHSLEDLVKKHERMLDEFLGQIGANVTPPLKITKKIELGSPASTILEAAQKERVDLIVMSTHGRTGLAHMLMGSVTEKVIRLASCPVFSIHQPQADQSSA